MPRCNVPVMVVAEWDVTIMMLDRSELNGMMPTGRRGLRVPAGQHQRAAGDRPANSFKRSAAGADSLRIHYSASSEESKA